MKIQYSISMVAILVLTSSTLTLGFPTEIIAGQSNPFGDCEVFQLGGTKRVTEPREFLDESQVAYFPDQDEGDDGLSIEIQVKETIFRVRLTLNRTTITLDKCNYITKRCTVEQETQMDRNGYIIPRKWNIAKLQVISQQLVIHIGPLMVFTVSLIGYPNVRMSWQVNLKKTLDYNTKKKIAMYGNQINYFVQFKCEDYEVNNFLPISTTELISSTAHITEQYDHIFRPILIEYDYDYEVVTIESEIAHELMNTTPSVASYFNSSESDSSNPTHQTPVNIATLDAQYLTEYDMYDTTTDPTTESIITSHFTQAEHSEQHNILLRSTTPDPEGHGNHEINTTEEDEHTSQYTSHEDAFTTSSFIAAENWTDKPELPKKTFDYFNVVLIAGLFAGAFIIITVVIYCVVKRRRSVSITENMSPEDHIANKH